MVCHSPLIPNYTLSFELPRLRDRLIALPVPLNELRPLDGQEEEEEENGLKCMTEVRYTFIRSVERMPLM